MQEPIYRAIDNTVLGFHILKTGAEVRWLGWPKCTSGAVEGANEAGSRVLDFYKRHRSDVALPRTPLRDGQIYLPAFLTQPDATRLPPLPNEPHDGMPMWRLHWQLIFGKQLFLIGSIVPFLGWPADLNLEPANDEAESVAAYYTANANHPQIPPSPWCDFARAIWLPDLPAIKPQTFAHDFSAWKDSALDDLNQNRIANAQSSLRQIAVAASRGAARRG